MVILCTEKNDGSYEPVAMEVKNSKKRCVGDSREILLSWWVKTHRVTIAGLFRVVSRLLLCFKENRSSYVLVELIRTKKEERGAAVCTHSEHRFPAPCRKAVLGVWDE